MFRIGPPGIKPGDFVKDDLSTGFVLGDALIHKDVGWRVCLPDGRQSWMIADSIILVAPAEWGNPDYNNNDHLIYRMPDGVYLNSKLFRKTLMKIGVGI